MVLITLSAIPLLSITTLMPAQTLPVLRSMLSGLNYEVQNLVLDSNYLTCQTRLGFNNTPVFNASVLGNKIIAGIPDVYGYYLWGFTDTDYPQNTFCLHCRVQGWSILCYRTSAKERTWSRTHCNL